jgi:hypothetical protein
MNFVVALALESGAEALGSSAAQDELTLLTRDGSMTFDGETFTSDGAVGPVQARLIVELAQALDWPAMVVEGDARSADEIIVAGVPLAITAINRCASSSAIRLIRRKYGHLIADTIAPLDPLAVVANTLEAAHVKPGKVEPAIEIAEAPKNPELKLDFYKPSSPEIVSSDEIFRSDHADRSPGLQHTRTLEAGDDRDAGNCDRQTLSEVAPSETGQPYSEIVSDCDEYDFPEPSRPTTVEEETRRRRAAELWENYVARNFEGLQWNPVCTARGNLAPPKPRESGPS